MIVSKVLHNLTLYHAIRNCFEFVRISVVLPSVVLRLFRPAPHQMHMYGPPPGMQMGMHPHMVTHGTDFLY